MACTAISYSLRSQYEPPVQFQYFEDSSVGGPHEANYCPVYGSVSGMKTQDIDVSTLWYVQDRGPMTLPEQCATCSARPTALDGAHASLTCGTTTLPRSGQANY